MLAAALAACGRVSFDAQLDASASLDGTGVLGDGNGASYGERVLASGPVAYYRLDEGGGGVAVDASGNGNDGAYSALSGGTIGYAVTGALGAVGSAVDLNGETGEIASMELDRTLLDLGADWTVELFFQPTAPAPIDYASAVFVCETYLTSGFRTGWNASQNIHIWSDEAGATDNLISTLSLTLDIWSHVVIVQAGGTITFYLDGAAAGGGAFNYNVGLPDECGIGAFHGMPSYGRFDELALYPRALAPGEVADHLAGR